MKKRCESCNSCGMPLENDADFALGDPHSSFCKYCVDQKGALLPYDTVVKSNAHYYKESQGISDEAATKMAKDLLKTMPAWRGQGV